MEVDIPALPEESGLSARDNEAAGMKRVLVMKMTRYMDVDFNSDNDVQAENFVPSPL